MIDKYFEYGEMFILDKDDIQFIDMIVVGVNIGGIIMSDYIIKIIPRDVQTHLTSQKVKNILDCLKSEIESDSIFVKIYETPQFIDSGNNLEKITCPLCGEKIHFDWWNKAMDEAYEDCFLSLSIVLPCCHHKSTLNDLEYDFPCGFAGIEFDILNPLKELNEELHLYIQSLFEEPIRIIHTHI